MTSKQSAVPLQPAAPLATLRKDYGRAVLHLAWDEQPETESRRLLFGLVELLPHEVPPPDDDGAHELRVAPAHVLHVRRLCVSARDAVGWYLRCRAGCAAVPTDRGRLPRASMTGTEVPPAKRFILAELDDEPRWPSLLCASTAVPFAAAWHACPRVHRLIPLQQVEPGAIWPAACEQDTALSWLSERLQFTLEDYPEYLGSVNLIAPNPVFRTLDQRLRLSPAAPNGV